MQDLINKILYSNKEESRQAKLEIEKLERKDKKKILYNLFIQNIKDFKENDNHQGVANFIYASKWLIFSCPEKDLDFWADFLLEQISSDSGLVRNAVVKVFPNLLININFSQNVLKKPSSKDLELMKKYWQLSVRIEDLLDKYANEKYHRYEYVSDLPASVFKSLNYLWVDLKYYQQGDKILDYYFNNVIHKEEPANTNTSQQLGILIDFERYLQANHIKIKIEDILEIIYRNKSDQSLKIALSYICKQTQVPVQLIPQFLKYLNILWNIFPHLDLDGEAPINLTNKKKYE